MHAFESMHTAKREEPWVNQEGLHAYACALRSAPSEKVCLRREIPSDPYKKGWLIVLE